MNKKIIIPIAILIIAISLFVVFRDINKVTNFEECVAKGYPVMESYPRKCRDPISKQTFTERVEFYWMYDGIHLLRHEVDGSYGCFGCSGAESDMPMCIDPIPEMKPVDETREMFCNSNFEIVKMNYTVGDSCETNSDCETPMEYLIQSNCPFGTACIDSKCVVVCPMITTCEMDSDCDCNERGERSLDCSCINNKCVSIEGK